MFLRCKYMFLCIIPVINYPQLCGSEPVFPPMLVLYSPGDPEYTDVLVKREHDNLTLVCELRGDSAPRSYVWNYVNNGTTGQSPYTVEPVGPTASSKLSKTDLQLTDSGQYMCSAPPFSVTKYILVQTKGPQRCARGAFWCGARCVLAVYVCDGRADCAAREDEAPHLCAPDVCARADKLNCSSGRCLSAAACCRGAAPLCRQPACCDEFPRVRAPGFADEYPPLFEDRHAPDDYGFIQSTIYTVTACALIFMIAVVLLVSAICKMHMKRAALRNYTHADRHHYTVQYAQAHRFPPCYEASRLLEENRTASPQQSPAHAATTPPDFDELQEACGPGDAPHSPRGLARLSAMFSSRYCQVPTQSPAGEQGGGGGGGGSPACCARDAHLVFRDAPPLPPHPPQPPHVPARRNTLERLVDQLDRQRLTLQLGRFQLSIPRLGRAGPRPDTPNVAEINIDELDFVRLNSNDTYTLNGRTIRLLGGDFEPYPPRPPGLPAPPSYSEAVRYKLYGPPPEYLSREGLNRRSADTADQEATSNVEMPPCYDDLNAINQFNGNDDNGNVSNDGVNGNNDVDNGNVDEISEENRLNAATNAIAGTVNAINSTQNDESHETFSSIIDNLPAIDSDVNANEPDVIVNDTVTINTGNRSVSNPAVINTSEPVNGAVTNALNNNAIRSSE